VGSVEFMAIGTVALRHHLYMDC